jgi:hypothetical protein
MANQAWNYDRGMRGNRGYGNVGPRSGTEFRATAGYGYDYGYRAGTRTGGYDRDVYDRNYKSDWQTAHGDPFGDRAQGTPIRAMEGSFKDNFQRNRYGYDHDNYGAASDRQGYDRGWFGTGSSNRYDRGWFGTGKDNRYDRGWFGNRSDNRNDTGWFGNRSDNRNDSGWFGNRSDRGYDRGLFGTRSDRPRNDRNASSPYRTFQRYDSSWW